jgi:hypothetical protein
MRDTSDLILMRYPSGGRTFTRTVIPPEETTTFNLVRRLAYWQTRLGGLVAPTSTLERWREDWAPNV